MLLWLTDILPSDDILMLDGIDTLNAGVVIKLNRIRTGLLEINQQYPQLRTLKNHVFYKMLLL